MVQQDFSQKSPHRSPSLLEVLSTVLLYLTMLDLSYVSVQGNDNESEIYRIYHICIKIYAIDLHWDLDLLIQVMADIIDLSWSQILSQNWQCGHYIQNMQIYSSKLFRSKHVYTPCKPHDLLEMVHNFIYPDSAGNIIDRLTWLNPSTHSPTMALVFWIIL